MQELRFQIYGFLFPNVENIPANFTESALRRDLDRVHLAILRTNHQIYLEATSYLYSSHQFEIKVSSAGVSFLGKTDSQLDSITQGRWRFSISPEKFSLIQNLRILIDLRSRTDAPFYRSSLSRAHVGSWFMLMGAVDPQSLERSDTHPGMGCSTKMLQTTHHLLDVVINHIERSMTFSDRPLSKLTLAFSFNNAFTSSENRSNVLSITKDLLQPFLRLRNITCPVVESMCYGQFDPDFHLHKIDLMKTTEPKDKDDETFFAFLEGWKRTLALPAQVQEER